MILPHPWSWIPERVRPRFFAVALLLTLALLVALQILGVPLRTDAAPSGIVSFELAGTSSASQEVLRSWGAQGEISAGVNLGLDYLFLFAYAVSIGLACILAGGQFRARSPIRVVGILISWALVVAATLDALENYALICLLLGSTSAVLPALARSAALIKFALVLLGLLYVVLAGVPALFSLPKRRRPMRKAVLGTALIAALLLAACQPGTRAPSPTAPEDTATLAGPTEPATPVPRLSLDTTLVIFDDDGSPDGTTALYYLLSHPQVSVEAIGISYGEAYPDDYIQHIGRTLDALGIAGILLGAGQDRPMEGNNEFPEWMREGAANFWGLPIPNPDKTYPVQPAAELIVSTVRQSAGPVTVFVSGPSTNLAEALRLDPGIRENIDAVFVMGGAVYVPGNLADLLPSPGNSVAEWNIYADPVAAKEVLESGLDIYLVPLDATNQVAVTRQDTRQWREGGDTADAAADVYDMLLTSWGADEAAIWDLMTAAIMTAPELCAFQPLHLQVVTEDGPASGQTIVVPNLDPNTFVCLEPAVSEIRNTLIEVFSSGR